MSLSLLIAASLLCALLYYLCPARLRWLLLLAASLLIYAYAGLRGVPFILLTSVSTWAAALCLGHMAETHRQWMKEHRGELSAEEKKAAKARSKARRRLVMLCCLVLNFGILALLKYLDPLLSVWTSRSLGLLLPLGISFYTFQSMGYLLDVYNEKTAPERNPLRFLLFVSFFPQLIQGPIARHDQLAGQLTEPHDLDLDAIERGLLLMAWGFFKKKVIADRALPFVSEVFGNHHAYGGAVIVIAVLLYSLQQYCDFSGGIDLVTGIAELFGIHLAPNFRRPYFASSLGDFWRRWHISLGSWMRDYVFYPFALSRPMSVLGRAVRKHGNAHLARALPAALGNILVFFLVGIWHGAQINYVLWGLYNGIILAVSALLEPAYKRFGEQHAALSASRGFALFRILRTFLIVNIGWYFDRCTHGAEAFLMLGKTFFQPGFAQLSDGTLLSLGLHSYDWRILGIATLLLFVVSVMGERVTDVRTFVLGRRLPLRWLMLICFLYFVVATFVGEGTQSSGFMYAVF